MKKFLNKITDLIFPQNLKCLVCGNELIEQKTNICPQCYKHLPFITNPCPTCGDQMENNNTYCLNCKNREHTYFKINRSIFSYSGNIKKLLINLKFNGKKYILDFFVEHLINLYNKNNFNVDVITYVPSSTNSIKKRGYSLTYLLAKQMSLKLNIPFIDCLSRVSKNNQVNKNYLDRQTNIANAFTFKNSPIKNKTVLLVDDVYTTGATINECSKVLKEHGAKEIICLTIAHTKKEISFFK